MEDFSNFSSIGAAHLVICILKAFVAQKPNLKIKHNIHICGIFFIWVFLLTFVFSLPTVFVVNMRVKLKQLGNYKVRFLRVVRVDKIFYFDAMQTPFVAFFGSCCILTEGSRPIF